MTEEEMREILNDPRNVTKNESGIVISTQLLTPHNDSIEVIVLEVEEGLFTVSDMGEAAMEIELFGLDPIPVIEPITKGQGLICESGAIMSPPLPKADIFGAIILVANAAKEAMFAALPSQK